MFSRKRKPVVVPDDTGQARAIREEAVRELAELRAQQSEVESIARKLERRRKQNHFGRDISITFRPKGGYS